ncbi:MAG: hypothetical protein CR991_05950 [Proteobacteria bacterium]|nr:MAG: hypothetical protein CR991_05950 [Pseudomonadota bacterium]
MKSIWLFSLFLFLFSGAAAAQQWEAKCVDGKNLHYLQTINGDGYLYMTVTLPDNQKRVFPFARVRQIMFNGEAVCAEIVNGLKTRSNQPVTQFCVNRRSNLIYMKHQEPLERQPMQSGQYCKATVIVR